MEKRIRKTGIDVLGEASWGTHSCLFYHTKEDLVDILVPYFKAGLENNEFCMWVTSEPLSVEDAKRSLKKKVKKLDEFIKKGQIEILDYSQWYTKWGKFESDKVLQGWLEKENQAVARGLDGIRLTGNTFWLEKEDWRAFTDYEAAVDSVIGGHPMLAVCTYSLERCGAYEVIDVVSNHQFSFIKRGGDWEYIENTERKRVEEELKVRSGILENLIEGVSERGWEPFDQDNAVQEYERRIAELEQLLGKKEVEIARLKNFFDQNGMENAVTSRDISSFGDECWEWFVTTLVPPYEITGGYLFFSADRDLLINIALEELKSGVFHYSKVSMPGRNISEEYVLCLYYKDDSRKHELARKYQNREGLRYGYWESEEGTLKANIRNSFSDP